MKALDLPARGVLPPLSRWVYNRTDMVTEWDPGKARLNSRKHGVSFADAVASLEDEGALTMRDPLFRRGRALGNVGAGCLGTGSGRSEERRVGKECRSR